MTVKKMEILSSLYNRLTGPLSLNHKGVVYGLSVDGTMVAVAAAGHKQKDAKESGKELELLNEMLPCGIEPMGVFICTEDSDMSERTGLLLQLPVPTNQDKPFNPVLLIREGDSLKAFSFVDGVLSPMSLGVITENQYNDKTVTIRVRGKLDLTCGFTKFELALGFKHLIEKVTCPYGSYVMEGGQVVFLHKFVEKGPGQGWAKSPGEAPHQLEEDCVLVGPVDEDNCVEDLWQFTQPPETDDGFGGKTDKVKKLERKDRLEFNIVWNLTNPACTNRTIGCAPIIHYEKKSAKTISLPVLIDALGVVPANCKLPDLMDVLKGSVARQIGDIAASVLSELSLKKTKVSTPKANHFRPADLPHFITIVYPAASDTCDFQAFRKSIHDSFMLATDRPAFRKSNAWQWPAAPGSKGKLTNVHSTIMDKHGVPGGRVAAVQGTYTYFHYMQDNFDDDQWGCAYRSLQTLISWFKRQGYTETAVPSHRDIQKCLVDIGDKEAKFIGSKQWIGSTEVGFVLETACNVQSRFISVSSGAELASKGRDLIEHFESDGSPVMIGGGVYAHTILGVAWDEATDACSWLILDPHYTGSDDLKTILAKGWCGWKKEKFWNQTAFYNMCLPQRPKNVL